jgi:membrane fusion protein (multidrug efflux system)
MKKILMSVTLGLTLVAGGCGSNDAKTATEEPVVPVTATRVERGDIASTIQVTGTIFPWQESMISPKVSGRIEKLFADEGDKVTRGQTLAELEQERLLIMIKESKASLQEARAQLRNLESTLERSRKLFREGVLDSQHFDDTATERDLAAARVKRAEALLERAEQDLQDSIISAPFDGFVVEKLMNEGEMATTMPPSNIFHLVDTSRVKIECDISEEKRTVISVGRQASITLDAYPGEVFTGEITTVNPKIDIVSRTFTVKIEIPNPDFKLESGMFARIRIAEEQSLNTLLIPRGVIIEAGGVKKVFLVKNGRAAEREITTGITTPESAEITGGLSEGDMIVTRGFYALKDGIKVTVQELSGGKGRNGEPS